MLQLKNMEHSPVCNSSVDRPTCPLPALVDLDDPQAEVTLVCVVSNLGTKKFCISKTFSFSSATLKSVLPNLVFCCGVVCRIIPNPPPNPQFFHLWMDLIRTFVPQIRPIICLTPALANFGTCFYGTGPIDTALPSTPIIYFNSPHFTVCQLLLMGSLSAQPKPTETNRIKLHKFLFFPPTTPSPVPCCGGGGCLITPNRSSPPFFHPWLNLSRTTVPWVISPGPFACLTPATAKFEPFLFGACPQTTPLHLSCASNPRNYTLSLLNSWAPCLHKWPVPFSLNRPLSILPSAVGGCLIIPTPPSNPPIPLPLASPHPKLSLNDTV